MTDRASGRVGIPPAALSRYLDTGSEALSGNSFDRGLELLRQAENATGRDRTSAYALLAADALITTACEEALEHEDPAGALARAVARISAPES